MKRTQYILSIVAILGILLGMGTFSLASSAFTTDGWFIETVDSTNYSGEWNSLALDSSGHPHILHQGGDGAEVGRLRHTWYDGSSWQAESVYYGGVIDQTSTRLDGNDEIHVCFANLDGGTEYLKYAHYDGFTWTVETVDSVGSSGPYCSLALDSNDRPHIAYYSHTHAELRYAHWTGTTWQTEVVDGAAADDYTGRYPSIALDSSDHPHISYYDTNSYDLRYAYHNGSTWVKQTLDSAGDVGSHTSLALGSNDHPYIAYYDDTNNQIKCTYRDSIGWHFLPGIANPIEGDMSLALDSLDQPHIAYYYSGLKHARFDGSDWQIEAVESGSSWYPFYTSLVLDGEDQPRISYYDSFHLRYAAYTSPPPPVLQVNPTSLTFTATEGGSNPPSQSFSITNSGGGTLTWIASDDAAWLSLGSTSGTAPSTVYVSVDISGLSAGAYTGHITVQAGGAQDSPQTVDVTLTVNPPSPVLQVSPTSLTFAATEDGSSPADQSFSITNGGGGTLTWTASDDAAWLSLGSTSGTAPSTVVASVNITGLSAGTYTAHITVQASGAQDSPQTVDVTLSLSPTGQGDDYEPDDTCAQANIISTDGVPQHHTFHDQGDADWVRFMATAGTPYVLETSDVGPQADTILELYDACDQAPLTTDDNAFGATSRIVWTCPADGVYYLKALNHDPDQYGDDAYYDLSVRAQVGGTAAIIVAGHNDSWQLQDNIDYCTNTAYRSFLLAGVPEERIYYLNPNPDLQDPDEDGVYDDVSAVSTAANLQSALETWAATHLSDGDQLFLYLMDHGAVDAFATDGEGDVVTPQMLDSWLNTVEDATGCQVNVIIEACHSGSFIDQVPTVAEEISEPGRVIIASTGRQQNAYPSSQGAYFSDAFWTSIQNSSNLWVAFQEAKAAVETTGLWQTPWLDDDGDATPNDPDDGQVAAGRGLAAFFGGRPPVVDAVTVTITAEGDGLIQAAARDDYGVGAVWAVIVPPSFQEPSPGEAFEWPDLGLPEVQLLKNDRLYERSYNGFDEAGEYRIIVYARDGDGNQSAPAAETVRTGYAVYLPLVVRNR